MSMFTQELGGSTSVATVLSVGTTPLTLVASNGLRRGFSVMAGGGPVFLGYASAVASQGLPLGSGMTRDERVWGGQVQVVAAVAGPVPVFVIDIT